MTPSVVWGLLVGNHGDYRRPCPDCDKGPRDDALSIKIDDKGACWHCFRCERSGSVARQVSNHAPSARPSCRDALQRVWSESVPLDHPNAEPARAYLTARGLADVLLTPPSVLRCHPRLAYFDEGERVTYPSLLALVQDRTGALVSIHRTYLAADGSGKAPVSAAKKLMPPIEKGACSRSAIRLQPISCDGVLAVAEGIESALSYWVRTRTPVWSCISAGGLERFWIPEDVRELHIIEDMDPSGVGQHAAMSLFKRAATRWRRAVYISPQMFSAHLALLDRRHLNRSVDMNDAIGGAA